MDEWKASASKRRDFRQSKEQPEAITCGAKKKRIRNFAVRYKIGDMYGFKFWPSYFEKEADAEKVADKYRRKGWIAGVIDLRDTEVKK